MVKFNNGSHNILESYVSVQVWVATGETELDI